MTWRPVLFRPHCPKRGATRSNAAVQPAFGALFACLWLGEKISLTAWVGGGLIVVASMLATALAQGGNGWCAACFRGCALTDPQTFRGHPNLEAFSIAAFAPPFN